MRKMAALALAVLLCATQAQAGLIVRETEGLVVTGADGVHYETSSGLVVTGADQLLGLEVNGVTATAGDGLVVTGADGLPVTGTNGLVVTGADGVGLRADSADGISVANSAGLVVTGADGLVVTGADGTTYHPASIVINNGDGLVVTGADGLVVTGADGARQTINNGLVVTGADGLVVTGADTLQAQRAQAVTATAPDGTTYSISPVGLVVTGADGLLGSRLSGVEMTNVVGLVVTGADGLVVTGADRTYGSTGLVSVDPLLLTTLAEATDDSNVNAAVVYHRAVTDADIADLQRLGVTGGTRFRVLPAVVVTATKEQLVEVSKLPAVRSIYGNTTLQWSATDTSRETTGLPRARGDYDLKSRNRGLALSGAGIGVAVIDTGIDGSHPDLTGRVARNVKLADLSGLAPVGFSYPHNVEGLRNTDLVYGHGTFVAGIIAGNSTRTGGRLSGYAPGAKLVGLSTGDANLFHVLAGLDYVLQNKDALNIRVVNCSFSANTVFNEHDPVNVATRMLADRGVNVVFSAGNTGPGANSLNPYALAPWVVSVAATDERGRPANFSSRGVFGSSFFQPTLTAPGTHVVSARSSSVSVTGALGLGSANDINYISLLDLPYYTTGSGTSFTAPQVAGTIALMLEANPNLTPAQVRQILQKTATPLPPFYAYEVGAGMLNSHAAVLAAAFPQRNIGLHRYTLDRAQVRFVKETYTFSGVAQPGAAHETTLAIPDGTTTAFLQVAWGPETSRSDLSMTVVAPTGEQKSVNALNLPGLTGKRERMTLANPETGAWRVRVGHTLAATATTQQYKGVLEVTRVESAPLQDVEMLAGTQTFDDVKRALRTFVMFPATASDFMPQQPATRGDLAAALMLGGRVPLYVAAAPSYTDLSDASMRNYVDSGAFAPRGTLFPTIARGGAFMPGAPLDRLTATIALVRAAGLRSEAESDGGFMVFRDGDQIPGEWNGYVRVAIARGLIRSDSDYFYPRGYVSRAELARALAVIERLYSE
ncbi:MAG TPA: S8 family serine peptidase [Pyrinomonadaceae bacterium]|nr:S8 family serine peptidase [Pyrinomonadaceae bacterium]